MKNTHHRELLMATTHLEEAPPWMRSDQYIQTGYRRCLGSVNRCLASLLYVHNELVNVWSHLLPGTIHTLVLVRECYTFHQQWDEHRYIDQLFVWQYIASCILCLLFSVSQNSNSLRLPHGQLTADRLAITHWLLTPQSLLGTG
jgi:adiponectin receptor